MPGTSIVSSAKVNGIRLVQDGEDLSSDDLRERAYAELLRQEAVRLKLIAPQQTSHWLSPTEQEQEIIESMLEKQVLTPEPELNECSRYYEANKAKYVVGQAIKLRHILFAVTEGVPVQVLAGHAETALLELMHKNAGPGLFDKKAKELSNCPSGREGGQLGWLEPHECAPELSRALFFDGEAQLGQGLHPRLIHSRHGLHIIDVLERRSGTQLTFDEVKDKIEMHLSMQSRATALRQYMMLLVGGSEIEGIELESANTPLVQN
ncbi:MAG: peptidylprolyl isomerase [Betaproteobacteria bacterium]